MKDGFRQSMAWLHTWSGLVVGWILFFVFITGTAGYIQSELGRWMKPELPLVQKHIPSVSQQFNIAYQWLQQQPDANNAQRWMINLQHTGRSGGELRADWQTLPENNKDRGEWHRQALDFATGQALKDIQVRKTAGGNGLYRMHYALHYIPREWAIRIVGICTMFMFVAIITGIITHKKIFKDFFTFRPTKGQRSWLDAHNVLSVIALPFHIMITYSGLLFFLNIYMPLGVPLTYGFGEENAKIYNDELRQRTPISDDYKQKSIANEQSQFINIPHLVADIEQQWGKNSIRTINIYPSNIKEPARIVFDQTAYDQVSRGASSKSYSLITGQLIEKENNGQMPLKINGIFLALHEGRFADGLIRWAYVITGLIGSGMIATGLVLWTVKRRLKATKAGKISFGHHQVEKLNIATVAGLPFAVAIYFWANRLIPVNLDERAKWEINSLFIAWFITFIYAICRPFMQAWREILCLGALAYLLLPILNVFTTDRHLGVTIPYGDWVLVNIEIGFILIGLIFAWAAWKVHQKITAPIPAKPVRKVPMKKTAPIDQGDEQ